METDKNDEKYLVDIEANIQLYEENGDPFYLQVAKSIIQEMKKDSRCNESP